MPNRVLLQRAGPAVLLAVALLAALPCGPVSAADTTRSLSIDELYLYPDDHTDEESTSFKWDEAEDINAVVRVTLGGFSKEAGLTLFCVIFDDEDKVVDKLKEHYDLTAGTHDLVLSDILKTAKVMGERQLSVKIEVQMKGVVPESQSLDFTVAGPDPPRVEIQDLQLYSATYGRNANTFEPGESFVLEATVEITENPGRLSPVLILYASMEEDSYESDPHESYQPYNDNWDRLKLATEKEGGIEGLYRIKATGRMPRFFSQPYENHHDVRIYAILDWGMSQPGKISDAASEDYASGEVYDNYPGDTRESRDQRDRLIELNRAYSWELKRIRGSLGDSDD